MTIEIFLFADHLNHALEIDGQPSKSIDILKDVMAVIDGF